MPRHGSNGMRSLLGEAFGTYFGGTNQDELLFIDKHAAHKRMLYEKLKEKKTGFLFSTAFGTSSMTKQK